MIYGFTVGLILAIALVIIILKMVYSPVSFDTLSRLYNGSAEDLIQFCDSEFFVFNKAAGPAEYVYEYEKKLPTGNKVSISYQLNPNISDYTNRRTLIVRSSGSINRLHMLGGLYANSFKLIEEKKEKERRISVYRSRNVIFSITVDVLQSAESNTYMFCSYEGYLHSNSETPAA